MPARFGAGFLAFAAPTPARDQDVEDQCGAMFNEGDAATLPAIYIENAWALPAGTPMTRGDIQKF